MSLLIWVLLNNQPSETFLMTTMNESWLEAVLQKYLVPGTAFPFRHLSTLSWVFDLELLEAPIAMSHTFIWFNAMVTMVTS